MNTANEIGSFVDLCNKPDKTELEITLIQCIAMLSTHPTYSQLDPQRIFEMMRDVAFRVGW